MVYTLLREFHLERSWSFVFDLLFWRHFVLYYIFLDNTSTHLCPCDCEFKRRLDVLATERNIPIEELERKLEPVLQSIKKYLTVDVKTLSSTKRKKTSADDNRKSSEQIGVLGAVILGVVVGLTVLVDLLSFQRHWKTLRQNCLQYT